MGTWGVEWYALNWTSGRDCRMTLPVLRYLAVLAYLVIFCGKYTVRPRCSVYLTGVVWRQCKVSNNRNSLAIRTPVADKNKKVVRISRSLVACDI